MVPAEIIQTSYNDITSTSGSTQFLCEITLSLTAGKMFERGTILPCRYIYTRFGHHGVAEIKAPGKFPPPVSGDSYAASQTIDRQVTIFCLIPTVGLDTRLRSPTIIARHFCAATLNLVINFLYSTVLTVRVRQLIAY